ncbi:uncharacterized protein G2W53_017707 [Senna tora]|uniref:Uncharacterized protein n=1 Tax=Senna tora TaxID=362788 RepID=A0A834TPQ7_9FABA|nr:uncharacterized protein G2W53_017707 [Senna tora]
MRMLWKRKISMVTHCVGHVWRTTELMSYEFAVTSVSEVVPCIDLPKSWFDETVVSATFNICDICYKQPMMKLHLLRRQDNE